MAHVHRQTYTRAIPAGAERVTVKKVPCVRWKGRDKQWVVAEICADKPTRCRVPSAKWYVTYYDHAAGAERTVPGYTDRAATDALMVKLVKTAARVDSGLLPPEAAAPRRALVELLERWRGYIRNKGASEQGAHRRWQRASAVIAGVKATRAAELAPTNVLAWVGAQPDWSRGTAVAYLDAVKGFTRWLAAIERHEPVDHLSGLAVAAAPGKVHRMRRALSEAEFVKLLDATRSDTETVVGLTPAERHALYLAAASTGLRALELFRLTAADLDEDNETVTLRDPAKTRTRRDDVLPLEAAVIRLVLGACARTGPLWPVRTKHSMRWWAQGARMIRHDLAAASIVYRDEQNRVFDFHSLRGQFATDLDRAGVTLFRAQKLMRHANPAMTAKHYTRPEAAELARDAAKLGRGKLANLVPNLGAKGRKRA